jgi:hypothetical protein
MERGAAMEVLAASRKGGGGHNDRKKRGLLYFKKQCLGNHDILVRIRTSDKWIRIRLLSFVTLGMLTKKNFHIFSNNLPAGTLSSVLKI